MDFDEWQALSPGRGRRAARVACVSAAREYGLELLHAPGRLHLWAKPNANVARMPGVIWHRSLPLAPPTSRRESIADVLSHVADCLPHVEARVVFESAVRRGLIALAGLWRIEWPHLAGRSLVREVTGRCDSLIETIAVDGLLHAGIVVRQQVRLLGHRVDALVGDGLVLQFDGGEFHAGPDARRRDAEQDARLMLAGYSVLRFTYQQIVSDFPAVLRTVRQAIEQGRHRLAPALRAEEPAFG